jgi:hypothetical protein
MPKIIFSISKLLPSGPGLPSTGNSFQQQRKPIQIKEFHNLNENIG